MKRVRGTVASAGSRAPPLSAPPRARRPRRPAPHVRPRPVQRSERGGRAARAASERASGAGTPRAAGASSPPASAPSPRALGAAGRRRLPGRWRCTSRSVRSAPRVPAAPPREPGDTLRVWGPGAEDGGGGRGIADAAPRGPGHWPGLHTAGPGRTEGRPEPGGGGWGRRGRARSSPLGGGVDDGGRHEGRLWGAPRRWDHGRGSGVSQHTVGTELVSGPGSAEGAARAVGL